MNERPTSQKPSADLPPRPTGLVATNAHQALSCAPAANSRGRNVLKVLGAFLLYLAITVVCLRLAWCIPGRGMEIILLRLLIGAWIPGAALIVVLPLLHKRRQQSLIAGFLLGICSVALALILGAIAIASKFRL